MVTRSYGELLEVSGGGGGVDKALMLEPSSLSLLHIANILLSPHIKVYPEHREPNLRSDLLGFHIRPPTPCPAPTLSKSGYYPEKTAAGEVTSFSWVQN